MFDIAWSEFMVVAVVALVVVGPRDLPALLRTVGKTVASLRRMAGEFQGQFNEAMREAELDGLKNELTGMKDAASKLAGPNPFQIARDELKSALTDKPKPAPSALAGEAPKPDAVMAPAPSALAPAPPPDIAPAAESPPPTEADFIPAVEPAVVAKRKSAPKPAAATAKAAADAAGAKATAAKASATKPRQAGTRKAANGVAASTEAKPMEAPASPPAEDLKPKSPGAAA